MKITDEELSTIIELYMNENNISYLDIQASMSYNKENLLINILTDLEDE